jgi:CRISPR/Cas system-associated endonuclease/helicase Cas3
MTKKLEDLLNMPDAKEIIEQAEEQEQEQTKHEIEREQAFRDIEEFDKINAALPAVKGLGEMADKELNEVADKAMQAYEDLFDLGMNVESRYSGRVFEVAGTMLKTSLDAKVAKLDKKLKMVEMQLKKEKLDNDNSKGDASGIINGEGYVVTDRNSLLERLKGIDKDK